jgi:hypothetical protein
MRSRIIHVTALISALAMVPGAVPAAMTQDNFLLRTAGDLVAVCSPAPDDPLMAVQANPAVASGEPADAILRYLQQTYPCAGGRP